MRVQIPKSLRFKVFDRDGFKCVYCGNSPEKGALLHADHVIPVSKGGQNEIENLVCSCSDCNLGKSDKLLGQHKAVDSDEKIKEMEEKYDQLKKYYKYLEKKKRLEEKMFDIAEFVKLGGIEPNKEWQRLIKKCIQKYGIEETIKGRNIFCEKEISEEKYFWGIMKEVQKMKDQFYEYKKEFYYKYLSNVGKYLHIRDRFFSLNYDTVIYIIENYGRTNENGERIMLCDTEYRNIFGLTEYHYQKALLKTIQDNYEEENPKSFTF